MALDDVPIKATSEEHASLKVHKVSDRELTEVRAVQCLLDGGHGVGVLVMSYDCEAYPVVSDAIIPYTHEHTNFKHIQVGTVVNLEFDIVGKYLCKMNEYAL